MRGARTVRSAVAAWAIAGWAACLSLAAEPGGVYRVVGRGAEGRSPYRGGGAVRFLDASLEAQVVHDDGGDRIPFPLSIAYDVIEPAPVLLTSRLGSERWRLYSYAGRTLTALYTDERIDLRRAGRATARAAEGRFGLGYGPRPQPGLAGLRGHTYFLIDQPDRRWLDVADEAAFFEAESICRKLTFTLADLSRYEVEIGRFQSAWTPRSLFRLRVQVRDAQGRLLPVVHVPLTAEAGPWRTALETQWGVWDEPTGWMVGRLPAEVPKQLVVRGVVTLAGPEGLERRPVEALFRRGQGRTASAALTAAQPGWTPERDAAGVVRETRAIWVSPTDYASAELIDRLVARCREARLNLIVPNVFVRDTFMACSPLTPSADAVTADFDPLARLIAEAHAAGMEVHPWFCVTYRDAAFRRRFRERHGESIDMIDAEGRVVARGADIHRAAYRQFIVDLMADVARDYAVDGVHLDYIRSMGQCYCDRCRREFRQQFGIDLDEATDEQWTAWQRAAVGDIVRRTADAVRRVRPGAAISAAVFANLESGARQGQDPGRWANQGWLDLVIPMDYASQTLEVRERERRFLAVLEDDRKLVTGLSLYLRSGDRVVSRAPELVRQQVRLVRRLGVGGYCLFAFRHMSDEQLLVLRDELNRERARPHFR